jgi:hypothetical protein
MRPGPSSFGPACCLQYAGRVCDQALPLERVAEGYRAMHERRAVRTLLTTLYRFSQWTVHP